MRVEKYHVCQQPQTESLLWTELEELPKPVKILRVHNTLLNVHINVRALQCTNSNRILSRLNSVHVHFFEETCCKVLVRQLWKGALTT